MEKSHHILRDLKPENAFFIGIDSDGCAFDTMEIKHKECFCPNFIKYWNLQRVSKYARETWEFVNLYSTTRGYNRFLALIEAMKLLSERPEVVARNACIPDMLPLFEWTRQETQLGNPALAAYMERINDPILTTAYAWSVAVNDTVAEFVSGIAPFPFMRESLEKMDGQADILVVSQTPRDALEREWRENGIDRYVKVIAGQEHGTKTEHLKYAAVNKYAADHILMIGDAPGDYAAAHNNGARFYPINPGHEDASWERFYAEGLARFFAGTYAGDYERALLDEFTAYLPTTPPWKSRSSRNTKLP